jgi:uncharacterized membrane protein
VRTVAAILVLALGLAGCSRKVEPPTPVPAPGATPAMGDFRGPMAAVGTEPFWRVDIQPGGQISLTRPAQEQSPLGGPYAAPAAVGGGAAFAAGAVKIQFTAGPCSDGMSETSYPYHAEVTGPGGVTLKGCGYAKWSAGVTALTPAIDACMAISGGRWRSWRWRRGTGRWGPMHGGPRRPQEPPRTGVWRGRIGGPGGAGCCGESWAGGTAGARGGPHPPPRGSGGGLRGCAGRPPRFAPPAGP